MAKTFAERLAEDRAKLESAPMNIFNNVQAAPKQAAPAANAPVNIFNNMDSVTPIQEPEEGRGIFGRVKDFIDNTFAMELDPKKGEELRKHTQNVYSDPYVQKQIKKYTDQAADNVEAYKLLGGQIDAFKESIKQSELGMQQSRLWYKVYNKTHTQDDLAKIKDLDLQIQASQQVAKDNPYVAKAAGTIAPYIWESIREGGKGYMIGAMVAGGAATAATGLSPIPGDEALIPMAAHLGGKTMGLLRTSQNMVPMEIGQAFGGQVSRGVHPDIARITSTAYGAASAALEFGQAKLLARLLPGGDKLAKSIVSKSIRRAVDKFVKNAPAARAATNLAMVPTGEAGIEASQQLVENILSEIGAQINDLSLNTNIGSDTIGKLYQHLVAGVGETFKTTFVGMGVFAIPGTSINYMMDKTGNIKTNVGNVEVDENSTIDIDPEKVETIEKPEEERSHVEPVQEDQEGQETEVEREIEGTEDVAPVEEEQEIAPEDVEEPIRDVQQPVQPTEELEPDEEIEVDEPVDLFPDDGMVIQEHAEEVTEEVQDEIEAEPETKKEPEKQRFIPYKDMNKPAVRDPETGEVAEGPEVKGVAPSDAKQEDIEAITNSFASAIDTAVKDFLTPRPSKLERGFIIDGEFVPAENIIPQEKQEDIEERGRQKAGRKRIDESTRKATKEAKEQTAREKAEATEELSDEQLDLLESLQPKIRGTARNLAGDGIEFDELVNVANEAAITWIRNGNTDTKKFRADFPMTNMINEQLTGGTGSRVAQQKGQIPRFEEFDEMTGRTKRAPEVKLGDVAGQKAPGKVYQTTLRKRERQLAAREEQVEAERKRKEEFFERKREAVPTQPTLKSEGRGRPGLVKKSQVKSRETGGEFYPRDAAKQTGSVVADNAAVREKAKKTAAQYRAEQGAQAASTVSKATKETRPKPTPKPKPPTRQQLRAQERAAEKQAKVDKARRKAAQDKRSKEWRSLPKEERDRIIAEERAIAARKKAAIKLQKKLIKRPADAKDKAQREANEAAARVRAERAITKGKESIKARKKAKEEPKKETTKVSVPDFENTQDAEKWGKTATKPQLALAKAKETAIRKKIAKLSAKKDKTDAEFQEQMELAVKAQLYREAQESAKGIGGFEPKTKARREKQKAKVKEIMESKKPTTFKPTRYRPGTNSLLLPGDKGADAPNYVPDGHTLYHVTYTNKLKSILESGLKPQKTATHRGTFGGDVRADKKSIYAIADKQKAEDLKADLEFQGVKNVEIIEFPAQGNWRRDPHMQNSTQGAGTWVMSRQTISPDNILHTTFKLKKKSQPKKERPVDKIAKQLQTQLGSKVKVVETQKELPKMILKASRLRGKKFQVKGAYNPHDKQLYLVAENLTDAKEAEVIGLHELVHGLVKEHEDKFNKVFKANEAEIRKVAKQQGIKKAKKATDEWLAIKIADEIQKKRKVKLRPFVKKAVLEAAQVDLGDLKPVTIKKQTKEPESSDPYATKTPTQYLRKPSKEESQKIPRKTKDAAEQSIQDAKDIYDMSKQYDKAVKKGDEKAAQKIQDDMKKRFGFLSNETGSTALLTSPARKGVEIINKVHDTFDVEAPWARKGVKSIGTAVKNFFSVRTFYEDQSAAQAKNLIKAVKRAYPQAKKKELQNHYADVVLAAESDKYWNSLSEEQKQKLEVPVTIMRDFFDQALQEYKDRGINDINFVENMIKRQRKIVMESKNFDARNRALEKLQILRDLKFIHIPSQMWWPTQVKKSTEAQKALWKKRKKSYELLIKKRKRRALSIGELLEDGVMEKNEINPVEIMLNYGHQKGKDFALLDIRDTAVKEGFAKETKTKPRTARSYTNSIVRLNEKLATAATKEETKKLLTQIANLEQKRDEIDKRFKKFGETEWVKMGREEFNVMSGYWVDSRLVEGLENLNAVDLKQSPWDKTVAMVKMMQFYNPFFMPMYDLHQSLVMAGGVKNPISWSRGMFKAIHDVATKSDAYRDASLYGLYSKPFNNPATRAGDRVKDIMVSSQRDGAIGAIEDQLKIFASRLPGFATKHGQLPMIDAIYNAAWNMAWSMDATIRQGTYNMLVNKGFDRFEAAQTAAKAHADYASVPAKTRKTLNRYFFTPTFAIVMAKVQTNMMANIFRTAMGFNPNSTRMQKRQALGAALMLSALYATDMLMRANGWERDEFGRRYTKQVDTPEGGEEQLVQSFASPINKMVKYLYWLKGWTDPSELNPVQRTIRNLQWEITPVLRTGFQLADNRKPNGSKIWNSFDNTSTKAKKAMKFGLTETIGVFRSPKDVLGTKRFDRKNPTHRKQLDRELNNIFKVLNALHMSFLYARPSQERRMAGAINRMSRTLRIEVRDGIIEETLTDEQLDTWIDNAMERIEKLQEKLDE